MKNSQYETPAISILLTGHGRFLFALLTVPVAVNPFQPTAPAMPKPAPKQTKSDPSTSGRRTTGAPPYKWVHTTVGASATESDDRTNESCSVQFSRRHASTAPAVARAGSRTSPTPPPPRRRRRRHPPTASATWTARRTNSTLMLDARRCVRRRRMHAGKRGLRCCLLECR